MVAFPRMARPQEALVLDIDEALGAPNKKNGNVIYRYGIRKLAFNSSSEEYTNPLEG